MSEYVEISNILLQHATNVEKLSAEFSRVTGPKFNSNNLEPAEFPKNNPTSEDIIRRITVTSREEEAKLQLLFINSCFERLMIANTLIWAQTALAQRDSYTKARTVLEENIANDRLAFEETLQHLQALKVYEKQQDFPEVVDNESYAKNLGSIVDEYAKISEGRLTDKLSNRMNTSQLLEKIFQQRVDFANVAATDIGITLEKINTVFNDYGYLLIAHDKKILEETEYTKKHRDFCREFCGNTLLAVRAHLSQIKEFLADTYDMGDGDFGNGDFKVLRWNPVTIRGLNQIAPEITP
jgi:hypothetical protein